MSIGLWDFTLAAYGGPGASAACIALQNGRGADVNLLFYACWHPGPIDAAGIAAAEAAVAPWRNRVVEPLRAVRDAIRAGIDGAPAEAAATLRKTVLGAEIEGERIAQAILAALPSRDAARRDPLGDAAANLAIYLQSKGVAGDADRGHVRVLLTACLPEAMSAAIAAAAARVVPA